MYVGGSQLIVLSDSVYHEWVHHDKAFTFYLIYFTGDLQDDSDIRHNNIIPGATLEMKLWGMWKTLVEAAAKNDTETVSLLDASGIFFYETSQEATLFKLALLLFI